MADETRSAARRRGSQFRRAVVAGPPWIALAPAFWMGWLPWWYAAPILVALVLTETWFEAIGRGEL